MNFQNVQYHEYDNSGFQPSNATPVNSRNTQLIQLCPLNCVCCLKQQVGSICSCKVVKCNVATQTGDFNRGFKEEEFWVKGTSAHSLLQSEITDACQRYKLKSSKDFHFQQAVRDVITSLPDVPFTNEIRTKVAKRMKSAIYWQTYYAKKSDEAKSTGMKVKDFLKTIRNAKKPTPEDRVPLLPLSVPNHNDSEDSDDEPLIKHIRKK